MNDLDLITDLTPGAPLPEPDELAPARDRLCAAITAERAGGHVPGLPLAPARRGQLARVPGGGPRARPSRWLVATAAAVALVAAGVTALVAVPGHGQKQIAGGAPGPSAARTAPAPSAVPPSGTVDVAAARFLRQAAATVRQQQVKAPGPDQYVYTETEPKPGWAYQEWLATYGNRDGLAHNTGQKSFVVPACTVEQVQVARKSPAGDYPTTFHCGEAAGYLPSMPAKPEKLLAYLYRIRVAQPGDSSGTDWAAHDLGEGIGYLMETTYLLPAQLAAIYELMARTPGFTVVNGVRDPLGRTGVAVEWTYEGARSDIILDPKTYAVLDSIDGALVKMAFVNRAGELP